jgi:hypothetical protein
MFVISLNDIEHITKQGQKSQTWPFLATFPCNPLCKKIQLSPPPFAKKLSEINICLIDNKILIKAKVAKGL